MAQLIQSPWASGLSSIAEAFAAAPGNRARMRQMELDAANTEADNALQRLRYDQEVAKANQDQSNWTADHNLAVGKDKREAELFPLTKQKTQGEIEAGSLANEFNKNKNLVQQTRIEMMPDLASSVADQTYNRVHDKLPEWNIGASLSPVILPPKINEMGVTPGGMDYADASSVNTAGMDEISRRDAMQQDIRTMANSAVLDDNFNPGQWIDATTKSMTDPRTGYRPASAEEKALFGVKPDAPMMMDAEGKPSILSNGSQTINVNGGASEKSVFDATKERADIARASSQALTALNNAEAALPGAITGTGANQRLALQKLGAYLGVGDTSKIVSTETFRAAIQPVVAAVLHSTVGSSQISDADRQYAEKAAAGDITLDEASINRLIHIMRAARSEEVRAFNSDLDGIYPPGEGTGRERRVFNVPQASKFYPSEIGPAIPDSVMEQANINPADVQLLLSDPSPEARTEFDAHYGPGASSRVLTGRQ